MKRKNLKSLMLHKNSISNLNESSIKAGGGPLESIYNPIKCAGSEGSCNYTVCEGPDCDLQTPQPR
jgi:hypothetical protein